MPRRPRPFCNSATLVGYGVVIGLATALCFCAGRADCPRAGQNRHQRHDPADGPDPGGAGGRGDGRRAGQAVSGAGAHPAGAPRQSRREAFLRLQSPCSLIYRARTADAFCSILTSWLLVLRSRCAISWVILTSSLAPTAG